MTQRVEPSAEKRDRRPSQPFVGVVATGDNDREIERICTRATNLGYPVLVTTPTSEEPAILSTLLENDLVTILQPTDRDGTPLSSVQRQKHRLVAAAYQRGAPGLVFVDDTSKPIDYEASHDAIDDRTYVVDAVARTGTDSATMIAIPAYNEGRTVRSVVDAARNYADDVVVVDDGSTDETTREAWRGGAEVVVHDRNRGYGATLQTAFAVAAERGVETLVIVDGDGQHDAADVETLVGAVSDDETNVAIGSRFVGESASDIPLYRRFGLGVINVLTNLTLGTYGNRIRDTQSGFRAYDRGAIETLSETDRLGDDMGASLDILSTVVEHDLTIEEISTVVDYDVPSASSQNPVVHGSKLVATLGRTALRHHGPSAAGSAVWLSVALLVLLGGLVSTGTIGSSRWTVPAVFVAVCVLCLSAVTGVRSLAGRKPNTKGS